MLVMMWLVKQIYLTDTCSVCVTNMVVIYWLMTMITDVLRGIFFFDNRWNVVPICVNLVWHVTAHYTHRCWLGPSRVSIAERDAYKGMGIRRI